MSRYLALSHSYPPCSSRAPPSARQLSAFSCTVTNNSINAAAYRLHIWASAAYRRLACCSLLMHVPFVALSLMSISLSSLGVLGLVADDMWVLLYGNRACISEMLLQFAATLLGCMPPWLTWKGSCRWGTDEHVVLGCGVMPCCPYRFCRSCLAVSSALGYMENITGISGRARGVPLLGLHTCRQIVPMGYMCCSLQSDVVSVRLLLSMRICL